MKKTFACFALLLCAFAVRSQEPPVFDVASIKPSDPLATGIQISVKPGGLYNTKGTPLKQLIMNAWDLRPFQISGGPGWVDTDRFDIMAKGKPAVTEDDDPVKMNDSQRDRFRQAMQMRLQALLADRFQLKTHKETKEMPIYALIVAKGGSKLQEGDKNFPGTSLQIHRADAGLQEMTAKSMPMDSFAKTLAGVTGRTVVDKTGLTGKYDFKINFAPDMQPGRFEDQAVAADAGPSLFTVLQEQLGLKLDSQKGPVEVLVIDSVQKPSDN